MITKDIPDWFLTAAKLLRLNTQQYNASSSLIRICVTAKSPVGVFDLLTVAFCSNVNYNIYSNFIGISARGRKRPTARDIFIELSFRDPDQGRVFLAESALYAKRHLGFDHAKADEIIKGIIWSNEMMSEKS